jgi:hypothetical protein
LFGEVKAMKHIKGQLRLPFWQGRSNEQLEQWLVEHENGVTQAAIAKREGLSRSRVGVLIAKARRCRRYDELDTQRAEKLRKFKGRKTVEEIYEVYKKKGYWWIWPHEIKRISKKFNIPLRKDESE